MSEAETQVKPAATKTGTEYVVLRRDDDGGGLAVDRWEVAGQTIATNTESAIRLIVSGQEGKAPNGQYVAVPARSFRPVTVKAEQTVTLKLEQAT